MKLILIDPLADNRWDNYIHQHPRGSVYHHSCWYLLIRKTFKRAQPHYLASVDRHGNLLGVLPGFISANIFSWRSLVCLPLATYCDPLFSSEQALDAGLNQLVFGPYATRFEAIELHACRYYPVLSELQFQNHRQYVTHFLPIDKAPEALKKLFHKTSVQQRIKRAERFNLQLEISHHMEGIKIFHHLHVLNRQRVGLPPLPRRFFQHMFEILYPAGQLSLLLVKFGDRYISAMIMLKFKQCAYAEYLATDPAYLRYHPNHFLWWNAIKFSHEEGHTLLDFGRSSVHTRGLIDFKSRWGAAEKQLWYYYYPHSNRFSARNRNSRQFQKINTICKRMPRSLLRLGGDVFYKYLY